MLNNFQDFLFTDNDLVFSILYSPITLVTCFFCIKLCCQLINIKITLKQNIISALLFGILLIIGKLYLPISYYRILSLIILPFIFIFIFKSNITQGILADVIMYIIVVSINTIFSHVYCQTYGIEKFKEGIKIPIYKIMLMSTYIIAYYITKAKNTSITINESIPSDEHKRILLLSILGLLALTLQLWQSIYYSNKIPIILNIGNTISILLYFTLSISNIMKISHINKSNSDIAVLQEYNSTLKILNDDVRAFKHDFNNIIQSIGGFIAKKDLEGLEEYYKQISKDCSMTNNLEMLSPSVINNPAIYNLINQKVNISQQYGIQMSIHISLDLNTINMKIYEMTRVLGILLDNAIEAAKETESKIINVDFSLNELKHMQIIKIENSYKEKDVDLDKIFEKSYSTKKGNTGLGLWEVRRILKRNNNLNLFTTKNSEFFSQQLEIFI